MTFILTAVCERPRYPLEVVTSRLVVRAVERDSLSWARAGHVPGLARNLRTPVEGTAYHVLTDEGEGYESSNVFASYPNDDEDPVRLLVPTALRTELDGVINEIIIASETGRCLLVFEDNGHVTSLDLTEEERESIDVVGPLTVLEFWRFMDLGHFVEDSVIILEDPRIHGSVAENALRARSVRT